MEKLLQWAVNNSNQEALREQAEAIRRGEARPEPKKFDPELIEAILGKDDATRMREAVDCIVDPNDTLENKEIALDNLEMLIEGIDNAMNIEKLHLWPKILSQLNAKEPEIRKGIAWVCGTAVQNNPEAQKAFLANNGLEPLVDLLKNEQEKEVRSKVMYAVSGMLKHCAPALEKFKSVGGFDVLADIVKRADDPNTLRKTIFLYNSLMIDNPSVAPILRENGALSDLEAVIKKYTGVDEDIVEKAQETGETLRNQLKE